MRLDHLLSMENREELRGDLPYSEIGKNHLTRVLCLQRSDLAVQFLEIIDLQNPIGGVAQLGEHLPCKQGVKGSIPFISTKMNENR